MVENSFYIVSVLMLSVFKDKFLVTVFGFMLSSFSGMSASL
jgi:hypothetical protein